MTPSTQQSVQWKNKKEWKFPSKIVLPNNEAVALQFQHSNFDCSKRSIVSILSRLYPEKMADKTNAHLKKLENHLRNKSYPEEVLCKVKNLISGKYAKTFVL